MDVWRDTRWMCEGAQDGCVEGHKMDVWRDTTRSSQIFTNCGYIHMKQLQLSNMFT
jgi:hypothetical protein